MNSIRFVIVFISLMSITSVLAQEWKTSGKDGLEYNCEVIRKIIEESYAEEPFQKDGNIVYTLVDVFSIAGCVEDSTVETRQGDSSFKVTVKSAVNLREGAGTSFKLAGQANPGEILEVVAEEGDWYEIRFGRGTAFIAGWLTTRLPDAIIETSQTYIIEETGCLVVPDASRSSDMDINVIITGSRKGDIVVDLYAPTKPDPLRVEGQLDKTFIDTGDTYIHQYYRWNQWFPTGIYTIEVEINDEVHSLAWNVAERAKYNLFVQCE